MSILEDPRRFSGVFRKVFGSLRPPRDFQGALGCYRDVLGPRSAKGSPGGFRIPHAHLRVEFPEISF